jgi:hypothetical protein
VLAAQSGFVGRVLQLTQLLADLLRDTKELSLLNAQAWPHPVSPSVSSLPDWLYSARARTT